jgi:hypothetical protein
MGACNNVRARLTLVASIASAFGMALAARGETRKTIDVSRALDAGASVPGGVPDIAIGPVPPDPAPLVERAQWVFDLRWARGDVSVLGTRLLQLPSAQPTPRSMGRFAIELYEGRALIERVRFDFPLLGAPEPDAAPPVAGKLGTRFAVMFPATRHGTRLELWDRGTNRRWTLPWPPRLLVDAGID